jgi:hypothetical protein
LAVGAVVGAVSSRRGAPPAATRDAEDERLAA